MKRVASDEAFTLIELVIAMAIMVVATAAIFTVMNPARGVFQAQPEVSDMQQRLRVVVDTLQKDLIMAGAGIYMGPSTGPLNRYVAAVLPYRVGESAPDGPAGVLYRPDTISVMYVPATAAQALVRKTTLIGSMLSIQTDANCGLVTRDRLCGFDAGTRALVFDRRGRSDVGTVASVDGQTVLLQGTGLRGMADPSAFAVLTEIAQHTYSLGADPATGMPRLLHYDGRLTTLPVADHIVSLRFEYFGDPQPPLRLANVLLTDTNGPWTTYGPKPPLVDIDPLDDSWPAGENCSFMVSQGGHVPRLATLGDGQALVALGPAALTDGPWCPDPADPNRFDADLLRIRRIRVAVRVEASARSFRGPTGPQFVNAGSASSTTQLLPDQEIRFDVAPRNLNLER